MNNNNLLDQIRRLNRAFLRPEKQLPTLVEGAQALAEICDSLVLIAGSDGTILASEPGEAETESHLESLVEQGTLAGDPGLFNLIKSRESLLNEPYPGKAAQEDQPLFIVAPIASGGKPFASLLLYRKGRPYDDDHLVLAEIGATMIGMLILQAASEKEGQDIRNKELAEGAFESLSYSEVEAIREILKNITNNESVVVASKIADNLGITRSVIVNALRKFESAGIIESRSLGMKGTFIRVKNIHALELVASRSAKMSYLR